MKRDEGITARAIDYAWQHGMDLKLQDAYLAGAKDADKHPKNPWQKVDSDPPKVGQHILVTKKTIKGVIFSALYCAKGECHVWGTNTNVPLDSFTHWMPAPDVE